MTEALAVWAQTATRAIRVRAIRVPATPLGRVRQIGYVLLGLQLAGFLVWSTILYQRFALTYDFAQYHQVWYLIAHGNFDPHDSVYGGREFWRNHSEFYMWPMALLYWLWPHGVTLLWAQVLCVVGAEAVAFTWLCELAGRRGSGSGAACLAGAGLVLLAGNPWTWWSVSWDFHTETVAVLFAVLLARDLANGRRRAWAWILPLLACGDVACTYVAGAGLGAVLGSRRSRRAGAVIGCVGVAAVLLIALIHGNLGSGHGLRAYAYLTGSSRPHAPLGPSALAKGVITHPLTVLATLWDKRPDLWANLAPTGLAGLVFAPLLPIVMVVLLANNLHGGWIFSVPNFQSVPLYVLVPVGTVAVLGWLARRHRRIALVTASLLAVQAVGWAAVWDARTIGQTLRVTSSAATTLASAEARIPPTAEVIASQGVAGRFSGRLFIHAMMGSGRVPIHGETWFVIAPLQGIETQATAGAMALIGELAGPLHATLVRHANGVWAFRWRPPAGARSIRLPGNAAPLPAWAASRTPGEVGRAVMTGPAGAWHMTSDRGRGYVADGLAWQEPPGRYQALVSLSAAGPVNVEVWNDTGHVLLARQHVPATTGIESVELPVSATTPYRARAYQGWGPFRAKLKDPPPGERLEVRVWTPGGHRVNVYSAQLTPVGGGRAVRESSHPGHEAAQHR